MSQSIKSSNDGDLDRLDVDEVKRFLQRRWGVIVGVTLACIVLAGIVCASVTPVYTATTQVLLDPRKQHVFGQDSVSSDSNLDSSIVDSQIPIIMSTRVLAKVATKENLIDDREFAGPARQGLFDRLFSVFREAKSTKVDAPSLDGIDPKLAPVIVHLFDKIDVTRVAKSYVLSLTVSSSDPAKATRLANSLAQTYVEDQISVRAKAVQQTAAFFEDRLGSLREQVRQSESAVAEYRKTHNLTTTIMDGPTTVGEQQLQNLNEKLASASADTAQKLAKYQQATRFKLDGTNIDSLPEIIRSPVITQLRTQQADLTRREADLSAMYGAAYPAITQIHAQRNGLDRAIQSEMKRLVSTLKNDYEVAKVAEDSMRKTIGGLTDTSGSDNEVGVKLRELQRANLANKALFENFLNRAKLTQEQSSFEEPDARLISPALEPTSPTSPKTKLILPIAAVAGLLLGLGLAAMLDLLTRRRTIGTPTARANAFILGRVPNLVGPRNTRIDPVAYCAEHPGSDFGRSIDTIAAKLVGAMPEGAGKTGGRVVTLSALSAREGATSLSLCIAASTGKTRKVLLIDADSERRGLSKRFDLADRPGLSDVIAGDLSANKALARLDRVTILPAGQKPLVPVAATAKALRLFLNEARARFDLILIDTPAFDAGPAAMALGAHADAMAMVACWDELLRDDFIAAVDAIADEANFAGIILNRTGAAEDNADFALAS